MKSIGLAKEELWTFKAREFFSVKMCYVCLTALSFLSTLSALSVQD